MQSSTLPRETSRVQPARMDQPTQSLTRSTPSELAAITAPDRLNAQLAEWTKRFNVLSPMSETVVAFAPDHVVIPTIVRIDTAVDPKTGMGTDTYFGTGFMSKGGEYGKDINAPDAQRGLTKVGLRKIARAAGVKWSINRRTDGQRAPYYWTWEAEAIIRLPDGDDVNEPGNEEVDLRDGSPHIGGWTPEAWRALVAANEAKLSVAKSKAERDEIYRTLDWHIGGWSEKRVIQMRRFGLMMAESKAQNRAIRQLGVAQAYTVGQLSKPFMVLKAKRVLDMSDPEIKRMVAAVELAGRGALYAHVPSSAVPARETDTTSSVIDAELAHDTSTTAAADDQSAPATQTNTAAHATETSSRTTSSEPLRVVKVDEKRGETNGRKWTVYTVTLSDGRAPGTFNAGIAAQAQRYQDSQDEVDVIIDPGKREGTFVLQEVRRRSVHEEPPLDFGDDEQDKL